MKPTIFFLGLVFLMGLPISFFAQDSKSIRAKHFNLENGLAMQGYDPVSYFSVQKPTKGNLKYATIYLGIKYYFSSEANKKAFLSNPTKYEPQYGGWCAFAMGENGEKVEINPETYKIIEGKLYLFYNAYFNNTLKSWNKNERILKAKANKNWLNFVKN